MGQIEIKVLDEKSLNARKTIVNELVESNLKDRSKDDPKYSIYRTMETFKWNSALDLLFNNKASDLKKALQEELKSDDLTTEEFNNLTLILEPVVEIKVVKDMRQGLQNQPRILWDGEIRKIDEIDEIVSYKIL